MEFGVFMIAMATLLTGPMASPVSEYHQCSVSFQHSLTEVLTLKRTCPTAMYQDCCQIAKVSRTFDHKLESGVYDINEVCHTTTTFGLNFSPMQASCNMDSGDGGWIVLVRRTPDVDERENFNRTWEEYENGFGNLTGEFWYGLKNMHCLTSREPMEVEVEVSKTDGTKLLLAYAEFRVDGPSTSYTLHVSGQKHKGHDYFTTHSGLKFSTYDNDNDLRSGHCAASYGRGGNWFRSCYELHLTAMPTPILWVSSPSYYDYAELRVRPKSCSLEPPPKCTE